MTVKISATTRLRFSPTFSLLPGYSERPLLVERILPYRYYRVSPRMSTIACQFLGARGALVGEVTENLLPGEGARDARFGSKRQVRLLIEQLVELGVLVPRATELSIYDRTMADHYERHRPLPSELVSTLIAAARLEKSSRVLDLAGGVGHLAVELAKVSNNVTLMDLSRGFTARAMRRAKREGVRLAVIQGSSNELPYVDEQYDVVIVSQALHWLDPHQVIRGLHRVLPLGGQFFLIDGFPLVPPGHPFLPILWPPDLWGRERVPGEYSVLQRFEETADFVRKIAEVTSHALGYRPLTTIQRGNTWKFKQRRPIDLGYAEACVARAMVPRAKWADVRAELAKATPEELMGTHYFCLTAYEKVPAAGRDPLALREIDWSPAT